MIIMKWIIVVISMWLSLEQEEKKKPKQWCWTKPVKKAEEVNITPDKGGPNWGYCAV